VPGRRHPLRRGPAACYAAAALIDIDRVFASARFECHLNVEVGRDITHDELLADGEVIETGLVLRSIGNRGEPVPGLPFDEATATVRAV
jgi:hypothetical protein